MIGRETAKSQATSIYRKLGVSSRGEAVAEAKRVGLISE
jgi:LuxR family maltose regulon positive regulatory protein